MADVIMPQMGESIAEGTVTKWLKNVGDRVERDEPLFEISTDKVDAEIPSPAAGVLKEIRVAPGATVPVNTVVAVIAESAAEAVTRPPSPTLSFIVEPERSQPAPVPELEPPPPPPPPVMRPPAAAVPPPSPPLAPEIPPVVADSPSAPVPAVVYEIEGEPSSPARPPAEATAEELRLSRSSPVVRRIAAEHHVDIREVPGTGIGGRVTKQDILGHIESRASDSTPPIAVSTGPAAQADGAATAPHPPGAEPALIPAPAPGPVRPPSLVPPPLPVTTAAAAAKGSPGDRVQVVPMSPIRRKTAEHMVLSKRTSAHVTTVFEIDMTRVGQLRDRYRAGYEQRGVRLTWMPFILKAVVGALQKFPVLNASVENDSIVYRRDINLGVAVALDWGLIVPVIQHAEEKNVLGLARAVDDLAERARAKKLRIEEVQGGTFTITNPGGLGSLFGTPIINQPQVAILDVGVIEKRPVVRDDAIAIRTMAFFALTFDHRLVDGADADRFMAHLKQILQGFDESSL